MNAPTPSPPSVTDRFSQHIEVLWRLVWTSLAGGRWLPAPDYMNYLRRTERRFLALVLAIRAGTLRPLRPRPSREAPSGPSSNPGAACPDPRSHNPFPRTRAWLCLLMTVRRHIAAGIIGSLRQFLDDPEMVALIQAEPRRFGRLLRPLFRIDGNQIPVCLRLPKRERPKREPKQRLAKFRPMKAAEFPHSKAQTLQRLKAAPWPVYSSRRPSAAPTGRKNSA